MTYARATLNVKLTVTWQGHCVTANLATFLSGHGRGMSDVSEHVGESAHHSMKPSGVFRKSSRGNKPKRVNGRKGATGAEGDFG